jgi:hypothetical protein
MTYRKKKEDDTSSDLMLSLAHLYHEQFRWILLPISDSETTPILLKKWKNATYNRCWNKFYIKYKKHKCNIGVLTGKRSGVIAVGIRNVNSDSVISGPEWWGQNVLTPIIVPKVANNANSDFFLFFKYSKDLHKLRGLQILKDPTTKKFVNIDILSSGNFVILPPSQLKVSQYSWDICPMKENLKEIPQFLLELFMKHHKIMGSKRVISFVNMPEIEPDILPPEDSKEEQDEITFVDVSEVEKKDKTPYIEPDELTTVETVEIQKPKSKSQPPIEEEDTEYDEECDFKEIEEEEKKAEQSGELMKKVLSEIMERAKSPKPKEQTTTKNIEMTDVTLVETHRTKVEPISEPPLIKKKPPKCTMAELITELKHKLSQRRAKRKKEKQEKKSQEQSKTKEIKPRNLSKSISLEEIITITKPSKSKTKVPTISKVPSSPSIEEIVTITKPPKSKSKPKAKLINSNLSPSTSIEEIITITKPTKPKKIKLSESPSREEVITTIKKNVKSMKTVIAKGEELNKEISLIIHDAIEDVEKNLNGPIDVTVDESKITRLQRETEAIDRLIVMQQIDDTKVPVKVSSCSELKNIREIPLFINQDLRYKSAPSLTIDSESTEADFSEMINSINQEIDQLASKEKIINATTNSRDIDPDDMHTETNPLAESNKSLLTVVPWPKKSDYRKCIIQKLLSLLDSEKRGKNFYHWFNIGKALHAYSKTVDIDPEKLFELWEDWSRSCQYSGCARTSWDEIDKMALNSFTISDLYRWAEEDNPEEYKKFGFRSNTPLIKLVPSFRRNNKMKLAKSFAKVMAGKLFITDSSGNGYKWDNKTKLWAIQTKRSIKQALYPILSRSIVHSINKLYKTIGKDLEKNPEMYDALTLFHETNLGRLMKLRNKINRPSYRNKIFNKIIKRRELKDHKFYQKINTEPGLIPVKNRRILDLRTGRLRRRRFTDYFNFEFYMDENGEYKNLEKLSFIK